MKAVANFVNKLRGVSYVERWNFTPHLKHETVAAHSFWVATFTALLSKPEERHAAVLSALLHDAEEAITGDLPALVKGRVPKGAWEQVVHQAEAELLGTFAIGSDERDIIDELTNAIASSHRMVIKCADLFAALMYAQMEVELGNTHFARIRRELIDALGYTIMRMEQSEAKRAETLAVALGFSFADALERPESMSHL